MHEQWKDAFEDALAGMADGEKAELIERIARSIHRPTGPLPTPRAVAARLADIAAYPETSPRDGFSGRDHDAVVYGAPRNGAP